NVTIAERRKRLAGGLSILHWVFNRWSAGLRRRRRRRRGRFGRGRRSRCLPTRAPEVITAAGKQGEHENQEDQPPRTCCMPFRMEQRTILWGDLEVRIGHRIATAPIASPNWRISV